MELWRRSVGLPLEIVNKAFSLDEIRERNWCQRFIELMHNRMILGSYRYGIITDPSTPQYDNVGGSKKRIKLYEDTGNLEGLVDAANLLMIEFVRSRHPKKHFTDTGESTERVSRSK